MSLSPPEWIHQWSQIIAGLGTVLLTIFLVILYKRQQQQLAANHKAILEVSDFEWDGDKITVYISNFGNGVATDLSLITLVYTDTGEHRKYSTTANGLKRQDKQGGWANTIQAGEENIKFKGKSRISKPAPRELHKDWTGTNFSWFIKEMKREEVSRVTYLHLIKGVELSNKRCLTEIYIGTRSLNPQNFEYQNSLENNSRIETGYNDVFQPYIRTSTTDKIISWIYYNGIRLINWILPRFAIRFRPLDASGTRRTKRVLLRRDIKYLTNNIKNFVANITGEIGNDSGNK